MSAFATVTELEQYWRALTNDEKDRAELLLDIASDKLRIMYSGIDDRVTADTTYANAVKSVVMESVKRAMSSPTSVPDTESYSQTAGPFSENYKFANPSGDLFFKKAELRLLGISGNIFTTISTSRTDIYGE